MTKETKTATLSREERNRIRILEEARKLFVEHGGTEGVNMHQIAQGAGVGQATLYRRYTEMGDVCIEVVKAECQPLFDELDDYLSQNSNTPPLDRLYSVIQKFAEFLKLKSPWLCSVSRTILGYRPMQTPLYQWMRGTCLSLLNEAERAGELADVDIPYTVEALLSVLHDIDFHLNDHGFSAERIVKGLRRIFIEGLKA